MAWVIVYRMGSLNYFVQKYRGELRFNGLINNAIKFKGKKMASVEAKRFQLYLSYPLTIMTDRKRNQHKSFPKK